MLVVGSDSQAPVAAHLAHDIAEFAKAIFATRRRTVEESRLDRLFVLNESVPGESVSDRMIRLHNRPIRGLHALPENQSAMPPCGNLIFI